MDPMLGNFEVWFNEWTILNGDFVNGYLVNGESSVILLFLKQNAKSTSTLSVISYQLFQLSIFQLSIIS